MKRPNVEGMKRMAANFIERPANGQPVSEGFVYGLAAALEAACEYIEHLEKPVDTGGIIEFKEEGEG